MRHLFAAAALALTLGLAGCSSDSFNITNPNSPDINDIVQNPTRSKLGSVATGVFAGLREEQPQMVWYMGTFGREGWNLFPNDPRNTNEALVVLDPSSFIGGGLWLSRYANIRLINTYQAALDTVVARNSPELTAGEVAASKGFAQTYKALAFLYVVLSRYDLGAPIDVDVDPRSTTLPPFVSQDEVYQRVIALLDSAATQLDAATGAGAAFPFAFPSAMGSFATPASFRQFNRALKAKALIERTTNVKPTACPTCFQDALALLSGSETFINDAPATFTAGAYHPYGAGVNDVPNVLSDALNNTAFFVHPSFVTDAQKQVDGTTPDARVASKTAAYTGPDGAFTNNGLTGTLKWTVYFSGGSPNQGAPIPIIKNEELILLRAEAKIGTSDLTGAVTDLNLIRQNSGLLPAYSGPVTQPALIDELLYNRRYSLAWEQGTRWIDARRYDRLNTLPIDRAGDTVFPRMSVPQAECQGRGLGVQSGIGCNPGNFPLQP